MYETSTWLRCRPLRRTGDRALLRLPTVCDIEPRCKHGGTVKLLARHGLRPIDAKTLRELLSGLASGQPRLSRQKEHYRAAPWPTRPPLCASAARNAVATALPWSSSHLNSRK